MPVCRLLREMNPYEVECWRQFFEWREEQRQNPRDPAADDDDVADSNKAAAMALLMALGGTPEG